MAESKILNHPDREEIIKQLMNGVSPNNVEKWLHDKYPNQKEFQVYKKTLSDFRKNYLNIDLEAARIIRKERQRKEFGIPVFTELSAITQEQHSIRVKEALLNSPTYAEKLKEITDAQLDAPLLIKELHTLLSARLEAYYNTISKSPSIAESLKTDKMFAEYVKLTMEILRDSKKIWDEYNAQPDEGTINLNVVHEQVGMIRDTVKELIGELDPGLAIEFIERLNERISRLNHQMPKPPNIIDGIEKINKRIKSIQQESGLNE